MFECADLFAILICFRQCIVYWYIGTYESVCYTFFFSFSPLTRSNQVNHIQLLLCITSFNYYYSLLSFLLFLFRGFQTIIKLTWLLGRCAIIAICFVIFFFYAEFVCVCVSISSWFKYTFVYITETVFLT